MIDPYGNVDTGHFWYVTNTFVQALNELKIDFVFVSPSCREMEITLSANNKSRCVGYKYFSLEAGNKSDLFTELAREIKEKNDNAVLIFTWLPFRDQSEYTILFEDLKNSQVAIAGISNLTSSSVLNYKVDYIFEFEELFSRYKNCKILWVWHEPRFINEESYKIRRLPEFHPSMPNLKENLLKIEPSNSVNFFGALSGHRGLSEFLILALLNPNIKFKAKGYSYSSFKLWRPHKFRWMRYKSWRNKPWVAVPAIIISLILSTLRLLPNLQLDKNPFVNDEEFQKNLASSKFLFYGCKLPHSSGVALTALASGVPVFWFGHSGEAVRFLKLSVPEYEIKYYQLFIPFFLYFKIKRIGDRKVSEVYPWESFVNEVGVIQRFN